MTRSFNKKYLPPTIQTLDQETDTSLILGRELLLKCLQQMSESQRNPLLVMDFLHSNLHVVGAGADVCLLTVSGY